MTVDIPGVSLLDIAVGSQGHGCSKPQGTQEEGQELHCSRREEFHCRVKYTVLLSSLLSLLASTSAFIASHSAEQEENAASAASEHCRLAICGLGTCT